MKGSNPLRPLPVLLALALMLALPGAASAGALTDALDGGCPEQATSQAFLAWGDPLPYALVDDGGFEASPTRWTLSGGATRVAGNQPFDASGAHSLRIPAGGSAVSPAVCLGVLSPTVRFFLDAPGSLLANLRIEVLVEDGAGVVQTLPVAVEPGLVRGWRPSAPALVVQNLFAALPGGAAAAVRLRASGGAFTVDDVYVDPYGKG